MPCFVLGELVGASLETGNRAEVCLQRKMMEFGSNHLEMEPGRASEGVRVWVAAKAGGPQELSSVGQETKSSGDKKGREEV